jgi:hypothetical protein
MYIQIHDFPSYLIDENGIVVSTKGGKWYIMTPKINSHGYHDINLRKNGKTYVKTIHRLVMTSWHGSSSLQVNHIDGNKLNNSLTNLEYTSGAINIQHAWSTGLCETVRAANTGEKHGLAKLSNVEASQVLALKGLMLQKEVAAIFGISRSQVSHIWCGRKRSHLIK